MIKTLPRLLALSLIAASGYAMAADDANFKTYADGAGSNAHKTVPSARISTTRRIVSSNNPDSPKYAAVTTAIASNNLGTATTPTDLNTGGHVAPAPGNTSSTSSNTASHTSSVAGNLATDPLFNAPQLSGTGLSGLPMPAVQISNVDYLTTVMIPTTRLQSGATLDVSLLDDFIADISPSARHYPPNFRTVTKQYFSKQKLKELEAVLRPYAENPNASYEVLLRAAKLNSMGRNLNLGSDYAVRASNYVAKAIERQPSSAEANFLYGMMLSEGGGFEESKKYLNKAADQGYTEAEQSLAQAEILTDNRSGALARLQRLQTQNPSNTILQQQIKIVQNGGYYIWDLPGR